MRRASRITVRATSARRSQAPLRARSTLRDKPHSIRNPINHFLENYTGGPLPWKKKVKTILKKVRRIRREREIRMAPVLGRFGAGAVFTSFIFFFVERPLMAYSRAKMMGKWEAMCTLLSEAIWRVAMWSSGNDRDLNVGIVDRRNGCFWN